MQTRNFLKKFCKTIAKRKNIKSFDKPYEEYLKSEADIFIGTRQINKTIVKCFLWLPESTFEEPHFYLLFESYKEHQAYEYLIVKRNIQINIKIHLFGIGASSPYECYWIKNAYFAESNTQVVSKNWFESYFKFHYPKHVLAQMYYTPPKEQKFDFYISETKLLTSNIAMCPSHTGEIKRMVLSHINITKDEIEHLGLKSISTDQYIINGKSSYLLSITPLNDIKSFLSFYKNIQPVVNYILELTSLAERRRLTWLICEGSIKGQSIKIYHTRTSFHYDKYNTRLICIHFFEEFLKTVLKNTAIKEIKYNTEIIRAYLSGSNYYLRDKIILWNSVLEKILKKNFQKKKDELKLELIHKLGVNTSGLSPMKDLIDIRNDIAHGDNIDFDKVIKLSKDWQILIERVILKELALNDTTKTDVHIGDGKSYGLYI